MTGARIGNIKLKSGGATVRVINREATNPCGENWRGKMISSARTIAGYATQERELVAYVNLGVYSDGSHSLGFRYDRDRCPIPSRLLPSLVADLIREDVITRPAANEEAVEVYNNPRG